MSNQGGGQSGAALRSALKYAGLGWFVFPLAGGSKKPLEGSHGFQAATLDQNKIEYLFGRSDFNVGIACGLSSLVVVDVDPKNNGLESLEDLESKNSLLPPTVICHTPSGGRHFYFKQPKGVVVKTSASKIAPGIDIRAAGGYVVAPPSVIAGVLYKWDERGHPRDVSVCELPDWLLNLIIEAQPSATDEANVTPIRVEKGQRNVVLTSLAGSMRRRGMGETSIAAALIIHNQNACDPPLDVPEVQAIAKSVMRYEPAADALKPLKVLDGSEHLTDLGNAKRFVRLHGESVRFVPAWNKWLLWDDRRWVEDERLSVQQLAKDTARSIYGEAQQEPDDDKRKKIGGWAASSESRQKLESMISLARSEPGVAVMQDELNRNPMLLTVLNGTLDLETGKLLPHMRKHQITNLSEVEFDPSATCPKFDRFLEEITLDRPELADYLQRAIGYSLTGNTQEQCWFLCYGHGGNGKTTLLNLVARLLGGFYKPLPVEVLTARSSDDVSCDLAELPGARFVISSESDGGKRLAISRIKLATGSDRIPARRKYGHPFSFRPQFKLWFMTNHKPAVGAADHGTWRRIRLIPFDMRLEKTEEIPGYEEILAGELPGILNWALKGCLAWQKGGLQEPDLVKVQTEQYKSDEDLLLPWIEGLCVVDKQCKTLTKTLYDSYKDWAIENDERVVSPRQFGNLLDDRGFPAFKGTGGQRFRLGLRLYDSFDEVTSGVAQVAQKGPNNAFSQTYPIQSSHEGLLEKQLDAPLTPPELNFEQNQEDW